MSGVGICVRGGNGPVCIGDRLPTPDGQIPSETPRRLSGAVFFLGSDHPDYIFEDQRLSNLIAHAQRRLSRLVGDANPIARPACDILKMMRDVSFFSCIKSKNDTYSIIRYDGIIS